MQEDKDSNDNGKNYDDEEEKKRGLGLFSEPSSLLAAVRKVSHLAFIVAFPHCYNLYDFTKISFNTCSGESGFDIISQERRRDFDPEFN